MSLIDLSIKFLISKTNNIEFEYETIHPWRRDGLSKLQHSLRVKSYVERILETENIILNDTDRIALPIASILHDVGNINGRENHEKKSVTLIHDFLKQNVKDNLVKERIIDLILSHRKKEERDNDVVKNLLIDADALDEIGMQSILMCSNRLDRDSAFFYNDLEKRIYDKEIQFAQKTMNILFFETSKEIVKGRIAFIELVVNQLAIENKGSISRDCFEMLTAHNTTSAQGSK